MTKLTGITPTPEQVEAAYRDTFGPAIQLAGGKDGRISRPSAERLAQSSNASKLVADNILSFLDATGQKTVGANKFTKVASDYARAAAEEAAGSNRKLSLVEIRNLPADLREDVRFLRGKSKLPPMLPQVTFTEAGLYPFIAYGEWQPEHVVSEGALHYEGDQLLRAELVGVPAAYAEVADHAIRAAWSNVLRDRAWNNEPLQLGPRHQGVLQMGRVLDETGREVLLVHWRDIDDGSFAWGYRQNAQGAWEQVHSVFLN